MWPFQKGSIPTRGFLTWLLAYVITYIIWHLFNFSLLSYPQGICPSPIAPVPFYAPGGPLGAPGRFCPDRAVRLGIYFSFYFWALLFLFVFVHLGMWPFCKSPSLMKQPVMGIGDYHLPHPVRDCPRDFNTYCPSSPSHTCCTGSATFSGRFSPLLCSRRGLAVP